MIGARDFGKFPWLFIGLVYFSFWIIMNPISVVYSLVFKSQEKPLNSFRVTLVLSSSRPRLDQVLLEKLREQDENIALKNISRTEFKELFKKKKIRIKKQIALPSSSLAQGTTEVDILGFGTAT